MWKPGWQPELLQQLQQPPAYTSQMEPLEPGKEYDEYPLDKETNVAVSIPVETTESSKRPAAGPITLPSIILPSIPMPTLVPRRGLLVIRWIFEVAVT